MNLLLTGSTGTIGRAFLANHFSASISAPRPKHLPEAWFDTTYDLAVLAHGPPPLAEHNDVSHRAMLDGHVCSTIELLDRLKMSPEGLVVLFTSIAAVKGSWDPSYAAAKGALAALVPTYAAKLPCRVVGISPGLIEGSTVWDVMSEEHRAAHTSRMRSPVRVSDVVALIIHLYVNPSIHNTIINIDGGYRL